MKIAGIFFDAGTAHIYRAWIERNPQHEFCIFAAGPAHRIFSPISDPLKMPHFKLENLEAWEQSLENKTFDRLVTGTSWGTSAERKAWQKAKALGISSFGLFDGYGDFSHGLSEGRPDFAIVFHPTAQAALKRLNFPADRIRLHTNFYAQNFKERLLKARAERLLSEKTSPSPLSEKNRLLFLSENISSCEAAYESPEIPRRGYHEIEALQFFFQLLNQGQFGRLYQVRIRPHPSEAAHKYDSFLRENVEISSQTLEEDLIWADTVVGCESQSLALACESGIPTYSCIPPHAQIPCRLPHREIIRLGKNA